MYDLIIVGAGPAGLAAALYSAFYKLKTLVAAKGFSGYSEKSAAPGLIDYQDLLDRFYQELAAPSTALEYKEAEVAAVDKNVVSFSVETKNGGLYYGRTVILAYGNGLEFGLENMSAKNVNGKIKADINQTTSMPGLFAAGDCAAGLPKDEFLSAEEGARAVLAIKALIKG